MTPSKNIQFIQTQLHVAFQNPLFKCYDDIGKIIISHSARELQQTLPQLLETLFNFDGSCPDHLNFGRLTSDQSYDFGAVFRFFSLDSPLFSLIVHLSTEPSYHTLYEFPFANLPLATRNQILAGKVPSFFTSKLKLNSNSTAIESVLLDAFELFMFHLAYYIVNPCNWKVVHMIRDHQHRSEWIYTTIINNYLSAFFPLHPEYSPPRINRLSSQHSAVCPQQQDSNFHSGLPGGALQNQFGRATDGSFRSPGNSMLQNYNTTSPLRQQQQLGSPSFNNTSPLQQSFVAANNSSFFVQQQRLLSNSSPQTFNNTLLSYISPKGGIPPNNPYSTPNVPKVSRLLKLDPQLMSQVSSDSTNAASINNHFGGSLGLSSEGDASLISMAVLQIFVDFWLNQFDDSSMEQQFLSPNKMLKMEDYFLHVRLLIKHLHLLGSLASSFDDCSSPSRGGRMVNSSLTYSPTFLGHKNEDDNASLADKNLSAMKREKLNWVEFRSNICSNWLTKKLFAFLKHHFTYRPLERPVVEIWLSFIQPWRYDLTRQHQQHEEQRMSEIDNVIENKWLPFIKKHIHFYLTFLKLFIFRFNSLDLTSHNNTLLISRVAKVFSVAGLRDVLAEAEQQLLINKSQGYHSNRQQLGTTQWKVSELEEEDRGENIISGPLFSPQVENMVIQLVTGMESAGESLESRLMMCDVEIKKKSWLQWFTSLMNSDEESSEVAVMRKSKEQLNFSIGFLKWFFKISDSTVPQHTPRKFPVSPRVELSSRFGSPNRSSDSGDIPDCEVKSDGSIALTPLGRYEIIMKRKKFNVAYQGDPDLQPIRSFECGPLVKFFFKLCENINNKYSRQIARATEKPGLGGYAARWFFIQPQQKPLECYPANGFNTPKKNLNWEAPSGSPLNGPRGRPKFNSSDEDGQRYNAPRLSLRFLARYSNLAFVLLFCLAIRFGLGWSFGTAFVLLWLVVLLLVIFMARLVVNGNEEKDFDSRHHSTPVRSKSGSPANN